MTTLFANYIYQQNVISEPSYLALIRTLVENKIRKRKKDPGRVCNLLTKKAKKKEEREEEASEKP